MNRRVYLATAVSIGLAGCAGFDSSDSTQDRPRSTDETPDTSNAGSLAGDVGSSETSNDSAAEDPDHPDVAGTFDDFEDLSRWTVLEGALSADERRSSLGSQSALLEAGPSDRRARISRRFDSPMDLSGVAPGLAATAEDLVVPLIRLLDDEGNRVDYRRGIVGEIPFTRHNFGIEDVDSDIDLTTITEIQLVLWTGERAARVWCDDLHFTPRPETGTVMIQFDDGFETDYTEALPILEEYGYPAVTFVNPGRIGNDGRLSLKQAERLRDAGWVVGNHSHTHPDLSTLNAADQEADIRTGAEWLESHGFEEGARYFAYPFGGYDATTLDLVETYHDLGFAGGRPVQGYAVNPVLCSRSGDLDASAARTALDLTAEMRGITTLFYHELTEALREDFEETMAHLHDLESAGDLEIVLPSDIEDEYLFRF